MKHPQPLAFDRSKITRTTGALLWLFAAAVLFSQSLMDFFASLLCLYLLMQWLRAKHLGHDFSPFGKIAYGKILFHKLWPLWLGITALGFFLSPAPADTPPHYWLSRLLEFRWILVLYFAVGALQLTRPDSRSLRWVQGAALLFSLLALGDFVMDPGADGRLGGAYRFPMTHAHVYGILFCFLLGILLSNFARWSRKERLLAVSTLAAVGTSVLFTYTRGAWMALVVAVIGMSFLWQRRAGLATTLGALVLAGGLYAFVPSIQERVDFTARILSPRDFQTSYDQERLVLWQTNWQIFRDHPWVGVGLGQNRFLLPEYYQRQGLPPTQFVSHAHNQYLQFLAGTGILGLLCYLGVLGGFWQLTLRAYRRLAPEQTLWRGFALGSLGGQIFFILGGLTESNFEHSKVKYAILWMWALGLWLWSEATRQQTRSKSKT